MRVRPARAESYEGICHESGLPAFTPHLRDPERHGLRDELAPEHLERAIGVVYRPDEERHSHYFYASLPRQFDEYIWFDETEAVHPLQPRPEPRVGERPDTHPFGVLGR